MKPGVSKCCFRLVLTSGVIRRALDRLMLVPRDGIEPSIGRSSLLARGAEALKLF